MIPAHALDGRRDAEPLVLLASLGSDRRMWQPQVAALADRYLVVRVDPRGHGASATPPGEYSLADLGGDVVALLDHLELDRVHLCGVSLGGMTALWLAVHHADRLLSLTAANTAARIGSTAGWEERIAAVEAHGLDGIRDDVLPRFCAPGFPDTHPVTWQALRDGFVAGTAAGYAGCCAALRDGDLADDVTTITTPTQVVGGTLDVATPPDQQRQLAAAVPGARLHVIDGAAHLSNLDRPAVFTELLAAHCAGAARLADVDEVHEE